MLSGSYTSKITAQAFPFILFLQLSMLSEIATNLMVMMTKKKKAVAGHDRSDMSTLS